MLDLTGMMDFKGDAVSYSSSPGSRLQKSEQDNRRGEGLMKPRTANTVTLWSALVVGALVGFLEPAKAEGNAGKPDTDIQIGEVKTFTSEEQAKRACGKDTVVRADRYAGYVYFPRETKYGRTSQGAFACLKSAQAASYWSTGPMSGMAAGHGPGRNFPFTPIPLPPTS